MIDEQSSASEHDYASRPLSHRGWVLIFYGYLWSYVGGLYSHLCYSYGGGGGVFGHTWGGGLYSMGYFWSYVGGLYSHLCWICEGLLAVVVVVVVEHM